MGFENALQTLQVLPCLTTQKLSSQTQTPQ